VPHKLRFRNPSPAMVIAIVALFVGLGGGAYAAVKLPRNSVGSKQIKSKAVTYKKLNGQLRGAVSQSGVVDRVTKAHLEPGQSTSDAVGIGNFKATCPKGGSVVGTGVLPSVGHLGFVEKFGRFVGAHIFNDSGIPIDVEVQAICTNAVVDVSSARATRANSRALRSFKAQDAAQRTVK
jgi:hypothetical protein